MAHRTEEAAAEPLNMLRHSAAHVLAAAVTRLHPEARYVVGPWTDEPPGFFYEFDLERPLAEEDLKAIEAEMRAIVKARTPFEHVFMSRAEALEEFRRRGQDYKVDLIERKIEGAEEDRVSLYRTGHFLDLCRGPHVESAGELRAFKLLRVSGAYLWGDEHNRQLQRVWGTAWATKDELADYLRFLEEAELRDHKRLGKELKLFTVDERVGAGLPLWLPNGATVRRELERFIVDEELDRGYLHVRTPDVARLDLYRTSGHAQMYAENMYPPMQFPDGEELELRPVNCPHHIVVFQSELRSYRDLPMRIAEIGNNWRYERSGTLIGLNRVRAFALNDAHIFCTPDQIQAEVRGALELALYFSEVLGIEDFWYRLSTRDPNSEKRLGTDAEWDRAEKALADALSSLSLDYQLGEGEAAFYGPKIDFQVRDAHRREFTNSTVQVDFQLPQRFDLEYVAEDGSRQRPVMIHRGAAGSMERVFSYLIERYAGAFPTWLHPVQVVVIPITDEHAAYAAEVAAELRRRRLRVDVDARSERMQKKIREAQRLKVPYMAIVGDREVESRQVSVRDRAAEQHLEALADFAERVALEVAERRR